MAFSTTKNLNIGGKYGQMMNDCTDQPRSFALRTMHRHIYLITTGSTGNLVITYKSIFAWIILLLLRIEFFPSNDF